MLIPEEIPSKRNLFDDFKILFQSYIVVAPDSRWLDILINYYGNNPRTMQDIGRKYNMTRERVRQLLFLALSNIRKLIAGNTVHKKNPRVACDPRILPEISRFMKDMESRIIISESELIHLLNKEYAWNESKESENSKSFLLNVLMVMTGLVKYDQEYIRNDSLRMDVARKIRLRIIAFLRRSPLWVSYDDISPLWVSYDDIYKNIEPKSEHFKTVLMTIPELEVKGDTYRLPLRSLLSSSDAAFRIMTETGRDMTIRELLEYMKKEGRTRIHFMNICTDDRFEAIGKSGLWKLKGMPGNTEPVPDLMEKALKLSNRPLNFEEMSDFVSILRPSYDRKNTASFVAAYPERFAKTNPTTIILKEWENKYPRYSKGYTRGENLGPFFKKIIEKLQKGPLLKRDLYKFINPIYPLSINTFVSRIKNSPLFIFSRKNGHVLVSLKPGYKSISPKARTLEDQIEESVSLFFKDKNKTQMSLKDVVEVFKSNYSKPTLYGAISNSKLFKKIPGPGRTKILILKKGVLS